MLRYRIVIAVALILLCVGCKGGEGLPVTVVHDTIVKNNTEVKVSVDSVYRYVDRYVYVNGDTVREVDSIYVYKMELRCDTVIDSIVDVREVPVEVERVQEVKVRGVIWWVGLAAIISVVSMLIINIYKRKRK